MYNKIQKRRGAYTGGEGRGVQWIFQVATEQEFSSAA